MLLNRLSLKITPHEDQIIDEKAWILLVWTTQSTNFLSEYILNQLIKLFNIIIKVGKIPWYNFDLCTVRYST